MCYVSGGTPYGYYAVKRPVVRLRRIHCFAATRWADAKTPQSMRFWKAIMDACIAHETDYEPIRAYWDAVAYLRGGEH